MESGQDIFNRQQQASPRNPILTTMKKNKQFEIYLMSVIKKYSKILLLDKHTFEVKNTLENKEAWLECVFNYPYLNVIINYGEKVIKKWKDKENIVPYIIHELCHPITDPLYCKATARYVSKDEILDEREKLTDYITNIVVKNNL